MSWSPAQYLAFEDERTRPVRDLVAAIPTTEVAHVADLGCGPGNSLEVLLHRFPNAKALGVDSSPEMIAAARARLPGATFATSGIADWPSDDQYDVILSNAALQWVPGHERLFPRLVECLTAGGSLAIQMPDNLDEPAQAAMRAVAEDPLWRGTLAGIDQRRTRIATVTDYDAWLKPHCDRVDIWRTTYYHRLAGIDAVVEWFKGSGLRPFLGALDRAHVPIFLERYRARVADAYPPQRDGSVLLPFPRLFIVATR